MNLLNVINTQTFSELIHELLNILYLLMISPFIVLTETKFSLRCIPVGIGTLLTGLGSKKKHM